MTTRTLLALALLAVAMAPAHAAFDCTGPKKDSFKAVCADRELANLDRAVEARFKAVAREADPLMALLLSRDQDWFVELLGFVYAEKPKDKNDPERTRIKDLLTRRLALLNSIKPRAIAATPAGTWGNALANIDLREVGGGSLRLTLNAKLAYQEQDDVLTCNLAGTLNADGHGSFAGKLASKDGVAWAVQARLQGNSLRLIRTDDSEHSVCGSLDIVTGSYFPTAPAAIGKASDVVARAVAPSFKCATAQNSDEVEICADPELAARDAEIARAFGETMRRLEPRLAARLRADQRAWVKDNATAFDTYMHPPWSKRDYMLHDTDHARAELKRRLNERLAMLANLDEKRVGLEGLWVAYNAALTIAPAEGKPDGTMKADGRKWLVGEYKFYCKFESDGRIEGGTFKATETFPALTRDGAMLITSAEDPDGDDAMPPGGHAGYCLRMHSAKARLFPVKAAAGAGVDFDRIR